MCENNIKFCIFSDLHSTQNSNVLHGLANKISLRMKQDDIAFIVNLGDSIGAVEEKDDVLEILKGVAETFAELPAAKHYVTGNHDLEFMTKVEFNAITSSVEPKNYYSFNHGVLHFIVLDMNFHPDGTPFANGDFEWPNAFLPEAELFWLKNDLKENISRPTFIFTHQNLDDRKKGHKSHPEIISNAADVRKTLESAGNVIAVFQGHGHRFYRKNINGIEYISIEASMEKPVFYLVDYADNLLKIIICRESYAVN
jgi:alkaline phosphatase